MSSCGGSVQRAVVHADDLAAVKSSAVTTSSDRARTQRTVWHEAGHFAAHKDPGVLAVTGLMLFPSPACPLNVWMSVSRIDREARRLHSSRERSYQCFAAEEQLVERELGKPGAVARMACEHNTQRGLSIKPWPKREAAHGICDRRTSCDAAVESVGWCDGSHELDGPMVSVKWEQQREQMTCSSLRETVKLRRSLTRATHSPSRPRREQRAIVVGEGLRHAARRTLN